jgi:uncharacterized protein YutE (UPF0331/DUF86 family)
VVQVGESRDITPEEYRKDWKTQRIIERTLQMAIEFRNVIAHEYARIDPALVVRVLQERLGDFSASKAAVLRVL